MKYRTMRFFVFLAFVGLCFGQDDDYSLEEEDLFFIVMDDNPFMRLSDNESGVPTHIEYLQTITSDSGLMIRVIASNDDTDIEDHILLNICEMLSKAVFDPKSSQARYKIAAPLGMTGSTCPIEPGVKKLGTDEFPFNVTIEDLGCDVKYYQLRIENENGTMEDEPIMEMRVNLHRFNNNQTCSGSSNNNLSSSSIVVCIIAALLAMTVTSYNADPLPGRKYQQ